MATTERITMNTGDIIPYGNNPRKLGDRSVEAVASSIKEFGYISPIIVDENNVVIAGHTRLLAMKKLGMGEAEVIRVSGLTDEQVRALRLADNKTAELSEWDADKLIEELDKILNIDMSDFGFDHDVEFDTEVSEDDYEVIPPEEPRQIGAELGDIVEVTLSKPKN